MFSNRPLRQFKLGSQVLLGCTARDVVVSRHDRCPHDLFLTVGELRRWVIHVRLILSCPFETEVHFVRDASDHPVKGWILTEEGDFLPLSSLLDRPVDTDWFGICQFKERCFNLVGLVLEIGQPRFTTRYGTRDELRRFVYDFFEEIGITSEPHDRNGGPIIEKIGVLYRFLSRDEPAIDPYFSRIVGVFRQLLVVARSKVFLSRGNNDGYVSHYRRGSRLRAQSLPSLSLGSCLLMGSC